MYADNSMAKSVNKCESAHITKAVVFLDVTCSSVLTTLKDTVGCAFDADEYIDVSKDSDFVSAWHERYGGHGQPSEVRKSELDDVTNCLVCYVTESKTVADADVAYAIFVAEIPTLALTPGPSDVQSPLLHAATDTGESARLSALRHFFAVSSSSGAAPVIVVEGGDGAGKQTQTALLVEWIRGEGLEVHTLDFPHDKALYGDLVRVVLSGKKGSISELDPQLFSLLYSLNRFGCARLLRFWLRRGSVVVLDRYYTANFGHQASKLPQEQRAAFIEELEFTEVRWLRLPKANAVLYLDLPPASALEAMRCDAARKQLDIHEAAGSSYRETVRQTYIWCCDKLEGWHRITCFDNNGHRLTREMVRDSVVEQLRSVYPRGLKDPTGEKSQHQRTNVCA